MAIEYLGLSEINGPLVALDGVEGASFEEMVEIRQKDEKRLGRVVALGERLGGYKQVERVEILPYHTLGVHKYEAMGKEYRLAGVQENTPEQSERAAALFREYFPTVVVN